jgi:hypothetical protein
VFLTLEAYPNISKMSNLSEDFSEKVGKDIDVYWNNETHNFVVTKHGERAILTEFLERQPINADQIRRRLYDLRQRGDGVAHLKKELTLQEIAVKANKEKDAAEKREQFEYASGEIYDYEIAGKHSITQGVSHKVR